MNNKRGFTLTELLAVIIILSLLALLTSTAVTKLVKDAKNDLNSTQIELIKSAAQTWGADNLNWLPEVGKCSYLTIQNLKDYGLLDSNLKNINTNNPIPDDLKIKISTTENETSGNLITTYEVNPKDKDIEGCYKQIPVFNNGDIVYFDVIKGKGCKEEEYKSSYSEEIDDYLNSITGQKGTNNQNSCLKFYAFNDNGGKTLNLLLDHNTTDVKAWTNISTSTNIGGPIDVIVRLENDTKQWRGTIQPPDYKYEVGSTSYTIEYKGYKARLITAQEIAQITGADKEPLNWKEESSTEKFDLDGTSSDTTSEYYWLFDRTTSCISHGCLKDSDYTYGYWTSSAHASNPSRAWAILNEGNLTSGEVNTSNYIGIRPVITILKSKLQKK